MKTPNKNIIAATLMIIVLSQSCIEYYSISTKVFKDGRLLRSITIKADEGSIHSGSIKIPTDSSWNIDKVYEYKTSYDTTGEKRITYTASKMFANSEELNYFLHDTCDTNNLANSATRIQRQFRWFYSYLTYTETYQKRFPFDHFALSDFLTTQQYEMVMHETYTYLPASDSLVLPEYADTTVALNHTDSLRMKALYEQLEASFWQYISKNAFAECYGIAKEVLTKKRPALIPLLEHQYDSLMELSKKYFFLELFDDSDNPTEAIAKLIHIPEDSLLALSPERFKHFEKQIEYALNLFNDNTIYNEIEMPGSLYSTNADSVYVNKCFWTYSESDYLARDFELISQARIINWWAFIGTSVFILGLTIGGFRLGRSLTSISKVGTN